MATAPAPVAPPESTADLVGIYDRLGHIEGRLGRIEGPRALLPHLASKADLKDIEARLYRSFWMMTVLLMASFVTAIGVATWVILSALPQ